MRRAALIALIALAPFALRGEDPTSMAPASIAPIPAAPTPSAPAPSAPNPSALATAAAPRQRPERPAAPVAPQPRLAPSLGQPPAPRPNRPAPAPAGQAAYRAPDASLCGDPRLRGARLPEVVGAGQCGISEPVRVAAVDGVRLTRPVTVGCGVARALAEWTQTVARPAARARAGAELASMTPFAGYACRARNSQIGARLSRHALGQAVDIGAFTLSDGREITVLHGWRGPDAAFLRAVWRGACGPFGTVLGPDADRWHRDHLHFDTARYRSGPYCR